MNYYLPGMGADHSMYNGAWQQLPDSVFIDWPKYKGETTLTEIATRLISTYNIQPDSVLVGSSLGGIVACEIANQFSAKALILVSSAQSKSEINQFLSFLHPIIDFAPLTLVQHLAGKSNTLIDMFKRAEPEFIKAMCKAIFNWDGLRNSSVPVYRIHGKKDLVITPPTNPDLLIDGGHLITMTHASECVDYIQGLSIL